MFTKPTALYGGSFDPVHLGHLHVASEVQKLLPEVEVVFVPAHLSPGKEAPLASDSDRLRWLRLAAEPAGFQVWDEELQRGGVSFTIDTLRAAPRTAPLYWILGADAYASFPHWREPDEIRRLARLLVVTRPGHPLTPSDPRDLLLPIAPHPASSTELRAALATMPPSQPSFLPPAVQADMVLQSVNPYSRK